MSKQASLLIVSPSFPPDTGVSVMRIMSLSKYLMKHDYDITILTNKKKRNDCTSHKYANVIHMVDITSSLSKKPSHYEAFMTAKNAYSMVAHQVLQNKKFDCILITGGPFYTFHLSKFCHNVNIPCILDFRDPWVFDYRGIRDVLSPKRILTRAVFEPMERSAVHNADAIVTVTPGWLDKFRRKYFYLKNKFYLIENGYDAERIDNLICERIHNPHEITIGIFGKLSYYSIHYTKMFLSSLNNFNQSHYIKIKLLQVGEKENGMDELLLQSGLTPDILHVTGFLNYENGIQKLYQTDAFLMIDNRKLALGTKIYDYIYLRKPIIFVGHKKSSFADLLSNHKYYYVCENKKEIEQALNYVATYVQQENKEQLQIAISDYSREKNNVKYMELIEKILHNKDKKERFNRVFAREVNDVIFGVSRYCNKKSGILR